MVYGTIAAYGVVKPTPDGGTQHFAGSVAMIPGLAQMGYIALTAFGINVIVAVALTFAFRATKTPAGTDATIRGDFFADEGDPRVEAVTEESTDLVATPV
jgi:SSS family solute:Na+ symporter